MTDFPQTLLAARFEAERPRLRKIALRMLGSATEADDIVQMAWLRLSEMDADEIRNLQALLTTIVARLSLDALRHRRSRREYPLEGIGMEVEERPDLEVEERDAVGTALLHVLDTLKPIERVAFVLHDVLGMQFAQVASILGKKIAATRQIASRARRRVDLRAAHIAKKAAIDKQAKAEAVTAFVNASQRGDLSALLELLAPEVSLKVDTIAANMLGADSLSGPEAVANFFCGRATSANVAMIDGDVGLVVGSIANPVLVVRINLTRLGQLETLEAVAEQVALRQLSLHDI